MLLVLGKQKIDTGNTTTVEDPELGSMEIPVLEDAPGYYVVTQVEIPEMSEYLQETNDFTTFAGTDTFTYDLVDEETAQPFIDKYSDEFWSQYQGVSVLITKRIQEIKAQAAEWFKEPVTIDVDGAKITFRGGQESASSIRDVVEVLDRKGLTTISVRDVNRVGHEMTLEQALDVAADIGIAKNLKWQAEEEALKTLETFDVFSYDTIDDAITTIKEVTLSLS